jgi:hypothetical protein
MNRKPSAGFSARMRSTYRATERLLAGSVCRTVYAAPGRVGLHRSAGLAGRPGRQAVKAWPSVACSSSQAR